MSRAKLRPIDVEHLSSLFDYFPETGLFLRKHARNPKLIAGTIHKPSGYLYLVVSRGLPKPINIWAHRAAFALYYKTDPYPYEIDHISRNRGDNRIKNLRTATPYLQATNKETNVVNRIEINIGDCTYTFDNPLEAAEKLHIPVTDIIGELRTETKFTARYI